MITILFRSVGLVVLDYAVLCIEPFCTLPQICAQLVWMHMKHESHKLWCYIYILYKKVMTVRYCTAHTHGINCYDSIIVYHYFSYQCIWWYLAFKILYIQGECSSMFCGLQAGRSASLGSKESKECFSVSEGHAHGMPLACLAGQSAPSASSDTTCHSQICHVQGHSPHLVVRWWS